MQKSSFHYFSTQDTTCVTRCRGHFLIAFQCIPEQLLCTVLYSCFVANLRPASQLQEQKIEGVGRISNHFLQSKHFLLFRGIQEHLEKLQKFSHNSFIYHENFQIKLVGQKLR